jgi:hypothetical protein
MKTPVDALLADEAARFHLRFACDDCAHFDAERPRTCAHGWPISLRRSALEGEFVSFCKEFELG